MRQYDAKEESPPAPVADCKVQNPISGAAKERQKAKLDTGASRTLIPEAWVKDLDLMPVDECILYDYKGSGQVHQTYFVDIALNGNSFEWFEVVSAARTNVLVGRDLLNGLKLILDGKNLCFELTDP
jgi:predicted aspartyl protease